MAKIIVWHEYYGCETGCCGHVIQMLEDDDPAISEEYWLRDYKYSEFAFYHPYGQDPLEWAKEWVKKEFGEEHVADLDWENCRVITDC